MDFFNINFKRGYCNKKYLNVDLKKIKRRYFNEKILQVDFSKIYFESGFLIYIFACGYIKYILNVFFL